MNAKLLAMTWRTLMSSSTSSNLNMRFFPRCFSNTINKNKAAVSLQNTHTGTEEHSGFTEKSLRVDSHHFCPAFTEMAFPSTSSQRWQPSFCKLGWGSHYDYSSPTQWPFFTKLKCQISEFALDASYVMCALLWAMLICFYFTSVLPFCLLVCLFATWIPKEKVFHGNMGKNEAKILRGAVKETDNLQFQSLKPGSFPALTVHEIPLCRYDKFSFWVS